jgi:glucokinase
LRTVLAGDLGGTKCRFALVSDDFGVHEVRRVATVRDRAAFLAAMQAAIGELLACCDRPRDGGPVLPRPVAAGFGTAGVVPPDGETITYAPNLPLDGFPLAQFVRERAGLPTVLINDGRASAWGEYLRGHAAGDDPLLCLFFGTGVGIGLIVDGRPLGGGNNAAGEIGHTTFRPGGRRCPCGRDGHFEAYCGGRAITERAAAEIGPRSDGAWNVAHVLAAADGGDARARAILDDAAEAAVTLTENACTLLNPRAVVLGGGVLDGWPALRQRIEQHVRARTSAPIHEGLRFVASLGGSDAILWGAAAATGALWKPGGSASI